MNISSFSTIGAIALTGLAFTFGTTSASAHSNGRCSSGHSSHGHSSSRGHCSTGHGHGRTCSHLPRGCRSTRFHGERCWYGGGHYYRCAPTGGYICIDAAPETEYVNVVERPVVQRRVIETEVEEEAIVDDDSEEEMVSYLPSGCETVYVGGERCWYHNGCYYRHCGHGYKKSHCGNRGGRGRTCGTRGHHTSSHGRTCSNGHGHSSHTSHSSHSSSHSGHSGHSGHSSSHGSHGHR